MTSNLESWLSLFRSSMENNLFTVRPEGRDGNQQVIKEINVEAKLAGAEEMAAATEAAEAAEAAEATEATEATEAVGSD